MKKQDSQIENSSEGISRYEIISIRDSVIDEMSGILDKCSKDVKSAVILKLSESEFTDDFRTIWKIIEAIKEVFHFRSSKRMESDDIRAVILSSVCGSGLDLKDVSKVFGIYQNRN